MSSALAAIARPALRIEGDQVFGLTVAAGLLILVVRVAVFTAAGVWRVARRDA